MNKIPEHIAIIMDGNGRWAAKNGLSRIEGHQKGAEVVDDIVEAAKDMGVRYITLYAFSDENWFRPKDEVDALMILLANFVSSKCEKMKAKNVRFETIGEISKLPDTVRQEVDRVKKETAHCDGINLILAISYGSQTEICRAFERLIEQGKTKVTIEDIDNNLDTKNIPNPELLIRTSGEKRISNFLLWQLVYSELYFTNICWPEFNEEELKKAVEDYQSRERRFGRVK